MKTKRKITEQTKRKTNPLLVETIILSKKNEGWREVASLLSGPRRKIVNFNINEVENMAKEGETVIISGKILSQGKINKKIKIVALGFSKKARVKLLKANIPHLTIIEEIQKNPEAKGVRILNKKEK